MSKRKRSSSKEHPHATAKSPETPAPHEAEPAAADPGMMGIERMHQLVGNKAVRQLMGNGQLQRISLTHFYLNKPASNQMTVQRLIKSPRFEGNEDVKKAGRGKKLYPVW